MKSAALLLSCKNSPRVPTLTVAKVDSVMESVAEYIKEQSGGSEAVSYQHRTVIAWTDVRSSSQLLPN